MITLEEVEAEVAHLRYKPGWQIYIKPHPTEVAWLVVILDLPNAYHQDTINHMNLRYVVPQLPNLVQFRGWLLSRVIQLEKHEAMEWLQYDDGRPVYDPHGTDRSYPDPDGYEPNYYWSD